MQIAQARNLQLGFVKWEHL